MEHPWHKSYPDSVEKEIDLNQYNNLVEILEETWKKFQHLPSFHCMGKSYTFGEIDILSKRFASYLQNTIKLEKGDRVALMMPNILQYPIALFGILRAGMIAVNVNPLYTPRELEHQLKDSNARAIIIFENSCHVLEKVIQNVPVKHVLTTQIGDFLNFPKSTLVNFVVKRVKKMIPHWSLNCASFKKAVFLSNENEFTPVNISQDDTAFLQYTGGTTGVSKGAELTHKNIVSNILQLRSWIGHFLEEGKEIAIAPLPLYHIFSLTANCLFLSSYGALNILITNPRDIPNFVKELKKWNFTFFPSVNTLFHALANNEEFKKIDFSNLKIALGGGMAVQKTTSDLWKSITGLPITEAYGLTETSPAACLNPVPLEDYNGSIGLPISNTEVQIKDDEEKNLPIGEAGEISIKGPQVMKGYWKKPEETAKVISHDGFFKTGDIGIMDENGFIKIIDRKKDMILVSGFNVYPNEVEAAMLEHPGVFECAAIGIPNEKSGEVVKLFVVKKDKSLTEEELRSFAKEKLTGYKAPQFYEFRDDLPKSNVGKILRKDLRN